MNLRTHQKECVLKIDAHLADNNEGLIKMFCGSGKSFVIYNCLLKYTQSLSVVVVPSINLITQFNKDYLLDEMKKEYNKIHYNLNWELLTICSKNELDVDTNLTTDEEEIEKFVKKNTCKIILITYQSLETLYNVISHNDIKIDLVCWDEAHHILSEGIKKTLFGSGINYDEDEEFDEDDDDNYSDIDDEKLPLINFISKSLYFTATPRNANGIKMYEPVNTITMDDKEYEIMDDENTYNNGELNCGPMIYEYIHMDGVNDNILNDFNIRVDMYTEKTDNNIFEAISRSILESGNNRVLTFHSRSETKSETGSDVVSFSKKIKEFEKSFKKVLAEFPKLKNKYKKIHFKGITANTKDRVKLLDKFDETPDNEIYILSSCKTIGEGVDTKNANMVVFVDPKQSQIEIIQNIGRICRKNERTKNLATVLIPVCVDVSKYSECKNVEEKDEVIRNEMSKIGNFNGILNVLSALRQEDPYMFELCLKYPETFTDKEITDNLKKNGLKMEDEKLNLDELFEEYDLKYDKDKNELDNFENLSIGLNKNIQIVNDKILEEDVYIDNKYEETLHLVKKDDKYVKTVSDEGKIVKKLAKPHRNIKPNVHMNKEIQVLWEIDGELNMDKKIFGGYIKSTVSVNVENWKKMLEKTIKHIDENNKTPSEHDKKLEIKQLGNWLSNQKQNYKKKIGIMKDKEIIKLWEEFMENYKEYFPTNNEIWINNLNKCKNHIDDNKKTPSKHNKNQEIKQLGYWLSNQKKNYVKKEKIMKDEEIVKLWEEFVEVYKEYFRNNNEIWINNLNKCKKHIDDNKKTPSSTDKNQEIKHLGSWLSHQKKNYEKKEFIMKDVKIILLWEEFVEDYREYFETNNENWINSLKRCKIYIDENKKTPSSIDKNQEIKQLGNWLSMQKNNNEKKERIMKDEEIRKLWEEFIENYKEYFKTNNKIWIDNLDECKKYIDENNEPPSKTDKKQEIKQLGLWLSTQKKNYSKKEYIMKDEEIIKLWEEFIENYKEYFETNNEIWINKLNKCKKFIDENKKRPSCSDKNNEIKQLGSWLIVQKQNYEKKEQIMKDEEIIKLWEEFIENYKEYFLTNNEIWKNNLNKCEKYIDENKKTPSSEDKNKEIKQLGLWLLTQKQKYVKKMEIMKDEGIIKLWEEFVENYKKYIKYKPLLKSTTIKPKEKILLQSSTSSSNPRKLSSYQELTKKMSIQNSSTTRQMFESEPNLWNEYHDLRDHSFKGYDNQDEIPVNKIIKYLETKSSKLKILDLGCGRNLIKTHFESNKKLDITGYDYVSFNSSKISDISKLPEDDDNVDICVYSQSLMGSNWKEYINEGMRVLRYNGEMIISESVERYEIIKSYINEQKYLIIKDDYLETNRWFYLYVINNK
jgi:superfamily II DNA or RNA helicase